MVKRLSILLALASGLSATSVARANPLDSFGFGSRGVALGGAVAADVEDPSAVYYNPAGLSRADNLRIQVGYMRAHSSLDIDGIDGQVEPVSGINLGIGAPIPIGSTRLAFGLGVHLPDQRISRTRSVLTDRPRWELYDTRPHKIFLSTALSFQPVRWIRMGAGITFQSPSELTLNLRGQADFFSPESSTLEHEFRGNLLSIRYLHAGVQVDPHERISVGVAYRGELTVRTSLDASVLGELTGFDPPIPIAFNLANRGVTNFFPQQVILSLAARPIDALRIGFDLQWLDWSRHPSLIANDTVELSLMLPPGFDLALPGEIRGRKPVAMGLRDRWVPRVGVEYRAVDSDSLAVDVRAGYAYERTPFPTQRASTNFVDNDRHALTLGAGIELRDLRPTLPGSLRIDAHFAYYHLPEREHLKLSPSDPVGDYSSGGDQFGFGASLEVLFE